MVCASIPYTPYFWNIYEQHASKVDTYTNQSIANNRNTSCDGALIVDSTIKMRTRAALGTLADEKLAAVDAKLHIEKKFVLEFLCRNDVAWQWGVMRNDTKRRYCLV